MSFVPFRRGLGRDGWRDSGARRLSTMTGKSPLGAAKGRDANACERQGIARVRPSGHSKESEKRLPRKAHGSCRWKAFWESSCFGPKPAGKRPSLVWSVDSKPDVSQAKSQRSARRRPRALRAITRQRTSEVGALGEALPVERREE